MAQPTFNNQNINLKESATDNEFQSTFLPLFNNAEAQIKKLIVYYFWHLKSKTELRIRIKAIISDLNKKLRKDLINRDAYINGLIKKSNEMIVKYYDKALVKFTTISSLIMANYPQEKKMPKLDTPQQVMELLTTNKKDLKLNMWAETKAAVRVENYPKEIKSYISNISNTVITTSESGKKPISLWQKAELDIRHSKQMAMLNDLKDNGVELAWTSSHPDCSKRCEKWQGKLMSLNEHSTMSGFRVRKVDGEWVYSLTDIMAQKDEYGYENNIINGFNCRHYLIPYVSGQKPPMDYTEKDIKKQRAIETKIRSMEREIRSLKDNLRNANIIKDSDIKLLTKQIKLKTELYKKFCQNNGYAWYQYRID